MSEIEGDGVAQFRIEDLEESELEELRVALKSGEGMVQLYAYVYMEIERSVP